MKVILKSDVPNLGRAGEILKVKPGYARNMLFPRNLALPARYQSLREWNHKKKMAELRTKKAQSLRNEIAKKIDGHKISIKKSIAPNGKLFGSVTAFEITHELKNAGFQIDKKFLNLKEPIKTLGEYKLKIDFGKESQAFITVSIQDEKLKDETKKPSKLSKLISFAKSSIEDKGKEKEKDS